MRRPFVTLAATGIALTALSLSACSSDSAEPASDATAGSGAATAIELPRIGTHNGYPYIPVALEQGYADEQFGQDASDIQVSPVTSGNDAVAALRAGNVDLVVTGYDPAGLVGVTDISMIALTEASPETTRLLVAADSDITSVEDLAGRTVASYTTTPNAVLAAALAYGGLTVDDVNYIPVENDVAASTLAGGGIDAWLTFDPAAANAELAGLAKVLVTGEEFGHLNPIVMYTTDAYLESNRDSVLATLRMYQQSIEWINANQEETAALVASDTGLSEEVAAHALSHRRYGLSDIDDDTLAFMEKFAERGLELGLITELPDLGKIIDNSVYAEAIG